MSDTIIDMPKVTQMLDAGWRITIFKSDMGSYVAKGFHDKHRIRQSVRQKLIDLHKDCEPNLYDPDFDWDDHERLITDDFTPEQALTRLAYKVHGEII